MKRIPQPGDAAAPTEAAVSHEGQDITREPLCTVAYCPAPSSPDAHVCVVCGAPAVDHHHVEGRGPKRTQDASRVILLCRPHHEKITLHEWGNAILDLPDGSRLLRIWDLHNETVHESKPAWMQLKKEVVRDGDTSELHGQRVAEGEEAGPVESPAVEQQTNSEHVRGKADGSSTAALSAGAGASEVGSYSAVVSAPAGPFYLTEWCERGMVLVLMGLRLQKANTDWMFQVGDWVNEGEGRLGEAAAQYTGVFSYWQLAVYSSVARRVPILCRHKELPFTYHQEVAALSAPEQREWLDRAKSEGMTRETLREAVHGPQELQERHECPLCHALHTVKA